MEVTDTLLGQEAQNPKEECSIKGCYNESTMDYGSFCICDEHDAEISEYYNE